jgi:DNA mismatch repair protein MutS2
VTNDRTPTAAPVPGDSVHTPLGRGVVLEVRQRGRLLVLIGSRSVVVPAGDATPGPSPARTRHRRGPAAAPVAAEAGRAGRRTAPDLDLHGLTVADALERVLATLDAAIRSGYSRVHVIHGRGSGRIRAALHRQLRGLPSVRAFRLDPANDGVTIVEL